MTPDLLAPHLRYGHRARCLRCDGPVTLVRPKETETISARDLNEMVIKLASWHQANWDAKDVVITTRQLADDSCLTQISYR